MCSLKVYFLKRQTERLVNPSACVSHKFDSVHVCGICSQMWHFCCFPLSMIHLDRIGTIFIGKETGEEEEVIRYDTYLGVEDVLDPAMIFA